MKDQWYGKKIKLFNFAFDMHKILILTFLLLSQSLFAKIDLDFSHKRGYYDTPFQLTLLASDTNAVIKYTTDLTKPSFSDGLTYTGPITITQTTIVKVYAYTATDESNLRSHSYIFISDAISSPDMYTYITQDSVYASQMQASFEALPVISLASNQMIGSGWDGANNSIDLEIETTAEMFFPDNSRDGFMINCGLQTWGGSPTNPKKHFRLEFKSIYGEGKLKYNVFKEDNYDDTEYKIPPVDEFDKLLLRSGSQDGLNAEFGHEQYAQYVRNRFLMDIHIEMGYPAAHGRFVHLFVNGFYAGQYHLMERPDENWFEDYFGGQEEEYEVKKSDELWNDPLNVGKMNQTDGAWGDLPLQINLSSEANIDSTLKYIDLDNAAAYTLMMTFAGGFDWGEHHNSLCGGSIIPGNGGFKFVLWDTDFTTGNGGRWTPNYIHNVDWFDAPLGDDGPLPNNLVTNLEFRYMLDDATECHCYNDGVFTAAKLDSLYMRRINQIQLSLIAESARWGGYDFDFPNNHVDRNSWDVNDEFNTELDRIVNTFLPQRTNELLNHYHSNSLSSDLLGVEYSQYGGQVPDNYQVELTNPNCCNDLIYYTLDGSEPRAVGGGVAPNAILYTGPFTLPTGVTTVKARIQDDQHSNTDIRKWSAMCPQTFYVGQDYNGLVINEIHYNPNDSLLFDTATTIIDTISGRKFEFVELKNTSTNTIFLNGVQFTKGITLKVENTIVIEPDSFVVFAEDPFWFEQKYGFAPDGKYSGKLDNSGENLLLVDPQNNVIDSITYDDMAPWDSIPDLGEFSLALANVFLENTDPSNWGAQIVNYTPRAENEFCPGPIINNYFVQEISCQNANDGAIISNVSGGSGVGLTYNWSNGSTQNSIFDLGAGTYILEIKDNARCSSLDTIVLTDPAQPIITEVITNQQNFNVSDGTISIQEANAYTYNWSNGATTSTISNLNPGMYTVTITTDQGCQESETYEILPVDCSDFGISISYTSEQSYNANDGSAEVNVQGDFPPFTISWSNGSNETFANNLSPNTYFLIVEDARGCPQSDFFLITEYICDSIVLNLSTTNETFYLANDGTANIAPTGGETPYIINWSNGASNTDSVSSLSSGSYSVEIVGADNCQFTESFEIQEYSCASILPNETIVDETSFEGNNGSVSLNPSGGISPYSYNWSTGETTSSISNLSPGVYDYVVTSTDNCSINDSVQINEYVCDSNFVTSFFVTDETGLGFNDGTASLNPSGGIAPYSILWSNGETTFSISDLPPGNYDYFIIGADDCQISGSIQVAQFSCNPMFTDNVNIINETGLDFNDGVITLNPSGGLAPYSYLWTTGDTTSSISNLPPGIYGFTITSSDGCEISQALVIEEFVCTNIIVAEENITNESNIDLNDGTATISPSGGIAPYSILWSNGDTSFTVTNLSPGFYSYTVTDIEGCFVEGEIIINEFACNPDFSATPTVQNETFLNANDGSISVTPQNGVSPYTISWDNGASAFTLVNLEPGFYTYTVSDNINCTQSRTVEIEEYVCDSLFTFDLTHTDESFANAEDGTANVVISGGVGPFQINWSNGTSGVANLENLLPGVYFVTVIGADNCSITDSFEVLPFECGEIVISSTVSEISCESFSDGSISIDEINGATEPYTFSWNTNDTTLQLQSLSEGLYAFNVTDANNCVQNEFFVLEDPDELTLSAVISDIPGSNIPAGNIDVTVAGGTLPYSFYWSTGDTTEDLTNVVDGVYTLTVTDSRGCEIEKSFDISNVLDNCQAPTNLVPLNPQNTAVTIFWNADQNAQGYTVFYKPIEDTTWNAFASVQNLVILEGLNPCTIYEFYITGFCSAGGTTEPSVTEYFLTDGECQNTCPATETEYGNNPILSGNYDAVIYVRSNGVVNASQDVVYKAGFFIEMISGFSVNQNGAFEAIIEECPEY